MSHHLLTHLLTQEGEQMADTIGTRKKSRSIYSILGRDADQAQQSRRAKRLAQHQHWMRVMMEGQATPDLTYQKPKI